MAGKSWQPSHEPPRAREKAGSQHTLEQVSGNREGGRGNHYKLSPHECETPRKDGCLGGEAAGGGGAKTFLGEAPPVLDIFDFTSDIGDSSTHFLPSDNSRTT